MTLQPAEGASFGPYRIESLLGAGGMGQVYLARDTRLGRKVALKILPPEAVSQPSRRERFLNEARAASALKHPNIVTIYDFGENERGGYLVMELVEGESLRALLGRRRPDAKQTLAIGAQVATALAVAHAAGIVHRDLKPENLMIGPTGEVKILDYGLAKLIDGNDGADTDAPTVESPRLTSTGTIVGTAPYMSPEQLEGRPVDHRSDIFSLGVVLYELLAGKRPFDSPSAIETAHKILNIDPPPVSTLNRAIPPAVDHILARAMAKNAADRYQHAGDMAFDLRHAWSVRPPEVRRPARSGVALVAVTMIAAVAGAFIGYRVKREPAPAPPPAISRITYAPLTTDEGYEGEPTFAPDGQTIAYVSDRSGNLDIYLKQISGGPDINLTSNPADDAQPAISPDGKQIAFVSTRSREGGMTFANPGMPLRGGDLWLMPLLGGKPRKIADKANYPSWTADGNEIVFVRGAWSAEEIYRVSSAGGDAQRIPLNMPNRLFVLYPSCSPDGKWILFNTQQPDMIYVAPLTGGKPVVVAPGRHGTWASDSKSVIVSEFGRGSTGTLRRISISDQGTPEGTPEPITAGPGSSVHPSLSRSGHSLAFATQQIVFNVERVRFDPDAGNVLGEPEPITTGEASNPFFTVSPDGNAIAFQSFRGPSTQIWRADLGANQPTQLTTDPARIATLPRWSPDGSRIAFVRSSPEGDTLNRGVWVMSADGGGPRQVAGDRTFTAWMPDSRSLTFFDGKKRQIIILDLETGSERALTDDSAVRSFHSVSADGKWIAYQVVGPSGSSDLKARNIDGTPPLNLVTSEREDGHPFFSPDGRWLYYQADHKNLFRIPGPAQGWRNTPPEQVTRFPESNLYLEDPQFSPDGKWLYYSRRRASSDLWLATMK